VRRAHQGGSALPACALYALIAASDFADGRLARRWDSESRTGRMLDHGADIAFLLGALSLYAWLGVAPWWVPAAIGASFSFYVFDSWGRADGAPLRLIGSRVGHAGGVLNWILVGVLVGNETARLALLPGAAIHAFFWLVPLYSGASVLARLYGRRPTLSSAA